MTNQDSVVETARSYYNSDDADNFYFTVWGGEDIHVGLYESPTHSIRDASRKTVERMASTVSQGINQSTRVLDLGAGYGGAARHLAKTYGCHVVALNLSEVENDRDRQMNKEQGLADKIDVVDAGFEKLDFPDNSFDVIWSQDAFLHSPQRVQVLREAARVLKPGGEMVFTDPMQADGCPEGVLQPILDRIHLDSLASPNFYRETCKELGMEDLGYEDHAPQLTTHYGRVLEELESREGEILEVVSRDYIERMKTGLKHWVDGGNNGYLAWGIFHFRKPS